MFRFRKAFSFAGNNHFMPTVCRMMRSRIFMGLLCLFLFVLSMRGISDSCNAFETERQQNDHFTIAPGIHWSHSSLSRIPLENRCSCSFTVRSCCIGPMSSTPQNSPVTLLPKDTLRRLSVLQAAAIEGPFDYKPLTRKQRWSHNFHSDKPTEILLVTCAFLI